MCAKYPSLRKAVLAAIDYEVFLDTVTDSSHILEGENSNMIMGDLYATDAFKNQDYYGPANQEVVDKYLAEAAKEGYTGEPVQIVYHNGRTDIPTLLCDAMKKAGIKYQFESMEDTTYNAFINEPSNNWDFYFDWTVTSYTPATLHANIIDKNINSAEVASLLKEMYSLDPTSDAYLAKWEEMANVLADECLVGYMSAIDWWWWHPETLNINDEGYVRYVFNTYWDDPENHPKK